MSGPTTLSDLQAGHHELFLSAGSVNYAHMVWPRMTKFGKIIQVVEKLFLRGQPHSHSKGHVPSIPQIFGTLPVWKWFDLVTNSGIATHTGVSFQGSSRHWQCLLQAGAADYITTHSSASIQASQWLLLWFPNFHQERSRVSPAIRGWVPPPQKFLIYFWSENGEFWCIIGGILCESELQETRYRPGKSKGAGSPTLATHPHFKPCILHSPTHGTFLFCNIIACHMK